MTGHSPRVAIYPGSFDPITNGHVSIIKGGLVAFDRIVVAVLSNPKKHALFTVDERIEMIREAIDDQAVEVDSFEGLLVDYCRSKQVRVVLRGLRAVADFEYELQMANMNRHLEPGIETVFPVPVPLAVVVPRQAFVRPGSVKRSWSVMARKSYPRSR